MTTGTPTRLYLLQLGDTSVPLPNGTLEMVITCYLVQTSDGKNILIDNGTPANYQPPHLPTIRNASTVIEQLHKLGLSPDDIDTVICTHFDIDHIGHNDAFPQAEFIVQRRQYDVAQSGHARYAEARPHWGHPALRYRLLDGDIELLPGLTLLETSGHAPGHQSVLLRLPKTGAVLLAVDAVMLERLFTVERKAGGGDDNEAELRASTQKLLDVVQREQVALTVFGHDGLQWRTLKVAPEYYD